MTEFVISTILSQASEWRGYLLLEVGYIFFLKENYIITALYCRMRVENIRARIASVKHENGDE